MRIRIRQYSFDLSEPFFEGQPLRAAEAQALNGLRAENIRNNMSPTVLAKVSLLGEGQLLDTETVAELQRAISAYDMKYEFVLKHQRREPPDPLAQIAREVAKEIAEGEALTGEALDNRVAELVSTDYVQGTARSRLVAREAIVRQGIEELL